MKLGLPFEVIYFCFEVTSFNNKIITIKESKIVSISTSFYEIKSEYSLALSNFSNVV